MAIPSSTGAPHVLVYPISGLGHTIPLLDLTHLLLSRGFTITFLVSHSDLRLLDPLISSHPSSLHPLVLSPPDLPPAPHPILAKIRASAELFNPIVDWFRSHRSPPVAIISDFVLGWTNKLASHLEVPRVVFWPSGALASLCLQFIWTDLGRVLDAAASDDEVVSFPEIPNSPEFPPWQVLHVARYYKEGDQDWEFLRDSMTANAESWGAVYNSFDQLEGIYLDYWKTKLGHNRVWAVGPLLPNDDDSPFTSADRGGSSAVPAHEVMAWLDEKAADSVVYVCFGSRATLSDAQMGALVEALECSEVHFVLCVKAGDAVHVPDGFEDRVAERGLVIRGWAPQVVILRHRAVTAFITHCGWNSTMEGIAAGVMMLAWPMMADQFMNAKLLVDQLGVAARVCEGGPQSVPKPAELCRLLAESVGGRRPEKAGVVRLREAASAAVKGRGSSSQDLDKFVGQLFEL